MLGEAKIYDGPSYHVNGLGQLLNRYVTGRECRNLMIVYVRKKDIKGLMEKLRKRLDEDLPVAQVGATIDHEPRRDSRRLISLSQAAMADPCSV